MTWSGDWILISGCINNQVPKFAITDAKLYVPVVTLATRENVKPLDQLKWGFERTINWNKYHSKVSIQPRNQYLEYLIDPSFQEVNRLFGMTCENNTHCTSHKEYFLPTITIKEYNVMIDGKIFFGQTVKNDRRTYDNIRKNATGQGYDYTTGCLLHYVCFTYTK